VTSFGPCKAFGNTQLSRDSSDVREKLYYISFSSLISLKMIAQEIVETFECTASQKYNLFIHRINDCILSIASNSHLPNFLHYFNFESSIISNS